MPLLQISTTCSLTPTARESITAFLIDAYVATMETSRDHVAVSIAELPPSAMAIGRGVDGPLLFLDAEIRGGRPFETKRAFAVDVMEHAVSELDVPRPNAKVVFTEHPGEHMMGLDRVGDAWHAE
jgi:phenylpyruvate tautomerase PptA (4-oxalocrotonate tautomerase family)